MGATGRWGRWRPAAAVCRPDGVPIHDRRVAVNRRGCRSAGRGRSRPGRRGPVSVRAGTGRTGRSRSGPPARVRCAGGRRPDGRDHWEGPCLTPPPPRATPPFSRRFTSAACCVPPELLAGPGNEPRRRAESAPSGSPRSRTPRSATSVRMQEDLGLRSGTDGEFPPRVLGTWTSSTNSAGSPPAPGKSRGGVPETRTGTIEFTTAALKVSGPGAAEQADFRGRVPVSLPAR